MANYNVTVGQGSWAWRRTFLFAINVFCAAAILLALFLSPPQIVALSVIYGAYGIMGASVLAYVFGAVVDDQLVRKTFSGPRPSSGE